MTLTSYKYCTETIELVTRLEEGFLLLGERLKKIRDNKLYLPVQDTFYDFLVECRMTESKASKVISVYEKFIEEYKFKPEQLTQIGWSLLYESIGLINNKKEAKEIVHELANRQDKDGRVYLLELKRGVSQDTCEHANTYIMYVCRDCGKKSTNETKPN